MITSQTNDWLRQAKGALWNYSVAHTMPVVEIVKSEMLIVPDKVDI